MHVPHANAALFVPHTTCKRYITPQAAFNGLRNYGRDGLPALSDFVDAFLINYPDEDDHYYRETPLIMTRQQSLMDTQLRRQLRNFQANLSEYFLNQGNLMIILLLIMISTLPFAFAITHVAHGITLLSICSRAQGHSMRNCPELVGYQLMLGQFVDLPVRFGQKTGFLSDIDALMDLPTSKIDHYLQLTMHTITLTVFILLVTASLKVFMRKTTLWVVSYLQLLIIFGMFTGINFLSVFWSAAHTTTQTIAAAIASRAA